MSDGIESRLKEQRRFLPSAEFIKHARIQSHAEYASLYRMSLEQPELFWREQTMDLVWRKHPERFLSWELNQIACQRPDFPVNHLYKDTPRIPDGVVEKYDNTRERAYGTRHNN